MIDFIFFAVGIIVGMLLHLISSHSQREDFKKLDKQYKVITSALAQSEKVSFSRDKEGNVVSVIIDSGEVSIDASAKIRIDADVTKGSGNSD